MHTNNPFPTYQVAKYSELAQAVTIPEAVKEYLEEIRDYGEIEEMVQSTRELEEVRSLIVQKLDELKANPSYGPEDIEDIEAELRNTDQLLEFLKQYNLDGLFMNS